jgi:hypothetical protein
LANTIRSIPLACSIFKNRARKTTLLGIPHVNLTRAHQRNRRSFRERTSRLSPLEKRISFILFRKPEITLFSIRYLSQNSLKDALLHLLDAFSKFSDDHPISAEIGSLALLSSMWFSLMYTILLFSTVFSQYFSIVLYFGFFFLAVFLRSSV